MQMARVKINSTDNMTDAIQLKQCELQNRWTKVGITGVQLHNTG